MIVPIQKINIRSFSSPPSESKILKILQCVCELETSIRVLLAAENLEQGILGERCYLWNVGVSQGRIPMARSDRNFIQKAQRSLWLDLVLLLLLVLVFVCLFALCCIFLGWREAEQRGSKIGNIPLDQGLIGFEVVQEVVPETVLSHQLST